MNLLLVVDAPLREIAGLQRKAARALAETARSRRVEATLAVSSTDLLSRLPLTLETLACLAAPCVLSGPEDLLEVALSRADDPPPLGEGLRLLVRRGARLLAAGGALDARGDAASAAEALEAVRESDLAIGAALLLAAGRWGRDEISRDTLLAGLGRPGGSGEIPEGPLARGLHTRLSWTRFHDVVSRHAAALTFSPPLPVPEARREVAHASDRFLEILRLFEEDRLGTPLPTWEAHVRAVARRFPAPSLPLFAGLSDEDGPVSRRAARRWPLAERLAPAVASLLDWDPTGFALVPALLDLPEGTSREEQGRRAVELAARV